MLDFALLARRARLEEAIDVLSEKMDKCVRSADYDDAAEYRDKVLHLQADLDKCHEQGVSVRDLDPLFDLIKVLGQEVPFGKFLSILSDEKHAQLRPLLCTLFQAHIEIEPG